MPRGVVVGGEVGDVVFGEVAVEDREPEEVWCLRGVTVGGVPGQYHKEVKIMRHF